MRAITVTAQSVSESPENCQPKTRSLAAGFGTSRQERRSNLGLQVGEVFNPFSLFDGALVPSEILRSRDLLPSEKLVFARLLQFAGGNGKAWPSLERVANEVALSVPQARRCISSLESKRFIRRVARSGRSNEFEFLWHPTYDREPRSPMIDVPRSSMSDRPQSFMSGAGQSPMIGRGRLPKIGPGRSSVIARRESIESSSSEAIQVEENQNSAAPRIINSQRLIDDDRAHRKESSMTLSKSSFSAYTSAMASRSIVTPFSSAFSGI